MSKGLLLLGFLLILVGVAKAETLIEDIDLNTALLYTVSDLSVDINISTDENTDIVIQLYDNNALREERTDTITSDDGNKQYYLYSFIMQFTEGHHNLDVNLSDSNNTLLDWKQETIHVQANPLTPDLNVSWELIQQYVLPLARSYSECIAEKSDLNLSFLQNEATMRALEGQVSTANLKKQEAEDSLANKKQEVEACNSSRSTCEADKTTLDSKLMNATTKCSEEKAEVKDSEEEDCEDKLFLKDTTIQNKDDLILEKHQSKLDMEMLAMAFGLGFIGFILFFAFLVFKGRVKL